MALMFGQASYIHQIPIGTSTPADGDVLRYSEGTQMWVAAASSGVIEREDTDCGFFVTPVSEVLDLGSFTE